MIISHARFLIQPISHTFFTETVNFSGHLHTDELFYGDAENF